MIEEILPGLMHWSAFHEGIQSTVHSTFVLGSGTLIDPLEPMDGLETIADLVTPRRIVLSNRHHYRHSSRYVEHFECPLLCHQAGLSYFDGGHPVQAFSFEEQIAPDVRALELGSICAEETTFLLDIADGVLSFGDGLTRGEDGSLQFMPDELLGDDPSAVKDGLSCNLTRILAAEEFDALLFAHAEPVLGGGRGFLSDFISREAGLPAI